MTRSKKRTQRKYWVFLCVALAFAAGYLLSHYTKQPCINLLVASEDTIT